MMFEFGVSHFIAIAVGAVIGAGALWLRRSREERTASEFERELRAELNLATQLAGLGTWRLDIATGDITADPALQQILGIQGTAVDRVMPVHPDDRQRVDEALNTAIHSTDDT